MIAGISAVTPECIIVFENVKDYRLLTVINIPLWFD